MDKFNKSQILKLSLIAALLIIAPLLSSSLRSTYLYFIFNLLIITLGADAGLLAFFSKSPDNKKPVVVAPPKAPVVALGVSPDKEGPPLRQLGTVRTILRSECNQEKAKVVAGLFSFFFKSPENTKPVVFAPSKAPVVALEVSPDKEGPPLSTLGTVLSPDGNQEKAKVAIVEKSSSLKIVGSVKARTVKKCPSTPSLFFIGGGEVDGEDDEDVDGEEVGVPSQQELFHRAETFIGNFYKQLKMQREESWKRIHGFYQKAF